jgi:hypothetical protein
MREVRSGVPMASSSAIEILKVPEMWAALAAVIITFIKSRNGRKFTITNKDYKLIYAEGLTEKELERVIAQALSITAIDTDGQSNDTISRD